MSVDRRRREARVDKYTARVASSSFVVGVAGRLELLRRRPSPPSFARLLGIASLASAVVLVLTGIFLMVFYVPSVERATYEGSFAPLHGVEVSKAYESTVNLSLEVRGGLLVRQMHHWAALLLPATLLLQVVVTFFTGAFRKPRRGLWVALVGILILVMVGGWSGYALPDDMLSGTGLRIFQGIVLSVPIVGAWASTLLFGGQFPGRLLEVLYPVHVLLVPVLLMGILVLVIRTLARQRPMHRSGSVRVNGRRANSRAFPYSATINAGMFALVFGMTTLMGASVTIAPIWTWGPADPGNAGAGSQPDWYTGFLDGALRIVPPNWDVNVGGYTLALPMLLPLVVIGLFVLGIVAYPFAESWLTRDLADHDLFDRPRNTPTRTALGAAALSFYGILWSAASADLIASHFGLALEAVVVAHRYGVLILPPLVFVFTRSVALALQERDRERLTHGIESGNIRRLKSGEYVEETVPLSAEQRARIETAEVPPAPAPRPGPDGHLSLLSVAKASVASYFLEHHRVPLHSTHTNVGDSASATDRKLQTSVGGQSLDR